MGELRIEPGTSLKGVDPRLLDIVQHAIAASPYDGEITSGNEGRGANEKGNHGTGQAIDVRLYEPGRNWEASAALPNKMYTKNRKGEITGIIPGAEAAYTAYEQYAQLARVYQVSSYPELSSRLRWGGGFRQGGTPFDMMHLDITKKAGGSMALYDWNTGVKPEAAAMPLAPKIKPNVALGDSRRYGQVKQQLTTGAPLRPPAQVPNVAPKPATASQRLADIRNGAIPLPRKRPEPVTAAEGVVPSLATTIGARYPIALKDGTRAAQPIDATKTVIVSNPTNGKATIVPAAKAQPVTPIAVSAQPDATTAPNGVDPHRREFVAPPNEGLGPGGVNPMASQEGPQQQDDGKRMGIPVPVSVRVFTGTVLGDKRQITEKDFTPAELVELEKTVISAEQAGRNFIVYQDYGPGIQAGVTASLDPRQAVASTIGMAVFKRDKDGNIVLTDTYDWNTSKATIDSDVKRAGGIVPWLFDPVNRVGIGNGWKGVIENMGRLAAAGPENARKVSVTIKPAMKGRNIPGPDRETQNANMVGRGQPVKEPAKKAPLPTREELNAGMKGRGQPAPAPAKTQAELNANMKGRGQPTLDVVVPDTVKVGTTVQQMVRPQAGTPGITRVGTVKTANAQAGWVPLPAGVRPASVPAAPPLDPLLTKPLTTPPKLRRVDPIGTMPDFGELAGFKATPKPVRLPERDPRVPDPKPLIPGSDLTEINTGLQIIKHINDPNQPGHQPAVPALSTTVGENEYDPSTNTWRRKVVATPGKVSTQTVQPVKPAAAKPKVVTTFDPIRNPLRASPTFGGVSLFKTNPAVAADQRREQLMSMTSPLAQSGVTSSGTEGGSSISSSGNYHDPNVEHWDPIANNYVNNITGRVG